MHFKILNNIELIKKYLGDNRNKKNIIDLLKIDSTSLKMFEDLIDSAHKYLLVDENLMERIKIYSIYRSDELKQIEEINDIKMNEAIILPENFDYDLLNLSKQAKEILFKNKPTTLGSASRIPGITTTTIYQLLAFFKKRNTQSKIESSN